MGTVKIETIKIGKYDVSKDDVWLYIQHFSKDKTDVFQWDEGRIKLHKNIFDKLNIDRLSKTGRVFDKELNAFCESHISKYDIVAVRAKQLSNAQTKDEVVVASKMLQMEIYKRQRTKIRKDGNQTTNK